MGGSRCRWPDRVRFPLRRGSIVWVYLDPTRGGEQTGTRPAIVIASDGILSSVPNLVIVLPVTTTDRGWPHHVPSRVQTSTCHGRASR